MKFILLNGKILPDNEPALLASNRAFRYGDGLFETMKVQSGRITLLQLHFNRLFTGLSLLQFDHRNLNQETLGSAILELCEKNDCLEGARARLTVYRGNGQWKETDHPAEYLIECWPLDPSTNQLNTPGWRIDVYPHAKKVFDAFSHLKSPNYLAHVMATMYAREHQLEDCLLLNHSGNIADATIANLFIIKGNRILTPSLDQGCVAGVMRNYLIDQLSSNGFDIQQTVVSIADLQSADEAFLTNAIQGIRWVERFRGYTFRAVETEKIYHRFVQTIS